MRLTIFIMLALCCGWVAAHADLSEETASANALSGVTALSFSPADRILSPLVLGSGTVFTYHLPFGDGDTQVWGFHNGSRLSIGHSGFGVSWLSHPDYLWRDHYLSYALGSGDFALGYTQHLLYESFSSGESYYTWSGDLGLGFYGGDYGSEVRWLRIGSEDAQWHFTAITYLSEYSSIATDYVYQEHGKDSVRAASSIGISDLFAIQTSWQSDPPRFGFGTRLKLSYGTFMYAVRTHPEMGLSHSVDVGFTW